MLLRPFASFRKSLLVRGREWFVIDWGIGDRAGDGIKLPFEHTHRRRYLARRKLLDQFVGFVCLPP